MTVPRKVEFIESYIKVGNDYQWNDNHGELIRCKDCKWYEYDTPHSCGFGGCAGCIKEDDYCSKAEPKENEE